MNWSVLKAMSEVRKQIRTKGTEAFWRYGVGDTIRKNGASERHQQFGFDSYKIVDRFKNARGAFYMIRSKVSEEIYRREELEKKGFVKLIKRYHAPKPE